MTDDEKLPITVTALRADDYSPDGRNVIISLAIKYSTVEQKYSVPVECFYDFITDLKRLNAKAGGHKFRPEHPETPPSMAADEHQASCFALEEEKGEDWKGTGATELAIKESKPSL